MRHFIFWDNAQVPCVLGLREMDFLVKCVGWQSHVTEIFQNIDKFISAETNYIVKTLNSCSDTFMNIRLKGRVSMALCLSCIMRFQILPFHVVCVIEWKNITIMTLIFSMNGYSLYKFYLLKARLRRKVSKDIIS